MRTKTFEHKGQAINYYKRVRQNDKVTWCNCCFSATANAWTVSWTYSK